ncbi:hypothetical protein D0862_15092 [Hortaea werneckii]|uniref:Uncharacterized protein n=1 Tax=Hortaea werneckii TaxID=91943 RepID=A0A3M7DT12_HORWE|nr:hypothetical protein D0862_15092 [Hortaea werneckii]
MSTSWLNKQRKQTLLDLSSEAGLDQPEDARKDSIVSALDTFLQANASRLSQNAAFEPYFGPRSRTPFKARSSSAAGNATSDDGDGVKSVVRGRGRRATRVKEEFDSEDPALSSPAPVVSPTAQLIPQQSTSSKRRTPATTTTRSSSLLSPTTTTQQPRLPASPADVANFAEYETSQLYAGLADFYTLTGLPRTLDALRESCSSLSGIQGFFMLLETFALHRVVLPWVDSGVDLPLPFVPEFLTTSTNHGGLGFLPRKLQLSYPDLFQLLSAHFWLPTLLWSTTSLLLPALAAYFFNLTLRPVHHRRASASGSGGVSVTVARYTFDPLMFNVVKAIATWMVYSRGVGTGRWLLDPEVVGTVEGAMWGGYQGVLVGCYVCVLAAVYEAVLRK